MDVLNGNHTVECTYREKELIGRNSLENDAPRNAHLRSKGETDVFILKATDY